MTGVWLAIDTATDRVSVAAGVPPQAAASAAVAETRRAAADIVRLVDDVLRAVGIGPATLAGIAVSDGPGGFTGLRIGWAAAKGLAHERELPLRAVPGLLGAAAAAARRTGPGPIAVCFDALRGQVFGAMYRMEQGRIETLVPPHTVTIAELARLAPERPLAVVGDGALRYATEVTRWSGRAPLALAELDSGAVCLLELVAAPGVGRAIDTAAEPVYGRPAEAQARWEARHGRALPDPTGRGG